MSIHLLDYSDGLFLFFAICLNLIDPALGLRLKGLMLMRMISRTSSSAMTEVTLLAPSKERIAMPRSITTTTIMAPMVVMVLETLKITSAQV